MPRLLFEKKGNAVWISHLDLMRVFQRAFKRAGLPLTHTKGFNPRPSVSIALPLSVGIESCCELLDFELDGTQFTSEYVIEQLNHVLVSGITVLDVYDDGRKTKDIAFLDCEMRLEYDAGVPECLVEKLETLYGAESLILEKKNKNGITEQDIIPMIRRLEISAMDFNVIRINCRICCQNPSLNPMQLHVAIEKYLPECTPDFVSCKRLEVLDSQEVIFR